MDARQIQGGAVAPAVAVVAHEDVSVDLEVLVGVG